MSTLRAAGLVLMLAASLAVAAPSERWDDTKGHGSGAEPMAMEPLVVGVQLAPLTGETLAGDEATLPGMPPQDCFARDRLHLGLPLSRGGLGSTPPTWCSWTREDESHIWSAAPIPRNHSARSPTRSSA